MHRISEISSRRHIYYSLPIDSLSDLYSMTVSVHSAAWFLEESGDIKMYKAICNYLSLGQFELARPLLRMHHETETQMSDSKSSVSSVINLMLGIIESGTPDGWICSPKSIRSTSHLHNMCIELINELVGHNDLVPEWFRLRCDFELRLTLALLESEILHNLDVANELRQRFVLYLSEKFSIPSSSIILPRLIVACDSGQLLVIESTNNPSDELNTTPLNLDCTEWVFDVCRGAPNCAPSFLEILHTVSPLISVQLTHIQSALVCDSLLSKSSSRRSVSKRWKRLCRQLRFLNELNTVILDIQSVNDPLMTDLFSLLVAICNSENGFDILTVDFASSIEKFINDCLSPGHGAFPFIMSKKRRSLFSLSTLGSDDRFVYCPNDQLRQSVYESLCTTTVGSVSKSLLQFFGELEDFFLKIFSSKSPIAPCFHSPTSLPFWDMYFEFLRVSGHHCLEYPASTAISLVKQGDMENVQILLNRFNQLKPLIILLCWELFDDVSARSALIEDLAESYLKNEKTKFLLVEQSVQDLAYFFGLSKIASNNFSISNSLDVLNRLRSDTSFLCVIRSALPSVVSGEAFFTSLAKLTQPSIRLTDQFVHDCDFAGTYFVFRECIGLVVNGGAKSLDLSELGNLCETISNSEIREKVFETILALLFSTTDCIQGGQGSSYMVEMHVFISLLCLVCRQAELCGKRARILLVKFLLALKQSATVNGIETPRQTVSEWVQSIPGSDLKMAGLCDQLDIPSVKINGEKTSHLTPPSGSMRIDRAGEFISRLVRMDLVQTALELNDYQLADDLVKFLESADNEHVEDAKIFANNRSCLIRCDPGDISLLIQDLIARTDISPILVVTMLVDLAISASPASDVSLSLLENAQKILARDFEKTTNSALTSWVSKLKVLLEAKTEFNSAAAARVGLSELILGIETLPNEPELLKDHLSRMHSQRSAIMSLVDRVDKFRKNTEEKTTDRSPENTGNNLDFLSDAIRTLEGEDIVGKPSDTKSSFLIKFLEYLNKICCLIQEAATASSVSFFSVLSEDPVDLVAKLVFIHKGIPQAISLCQIMGLDMVDVIADHSVSVTDMEQVVGKFFISRDILESLADADVEKSKIVGIALERRSERWPCAEILDFASDDKVWVEGRKLAWEKFVRSFQVLTGRDVERGFTIEEERELDDETRLALRAVHSETRQSMDALCRMAARALMLQGKYIWALEELDTNLVSCDSLLVNEALMGCLVHCSDSLTPQNIYELLWRVKDSKSLIVFVKKFYRKWDAKLAMKSLELCVERIENDPEAESFVLHEIKVIRVMDKVSCAVTLSHGGWQGLQDLENLQECVSVIRSLLSVFQHSLADEFLVLKSKILADQVDALADEIELSRLGSMWKNHEKLLERLQTFHHPLKASRLAVQLLSSIKVVSNRIVLSEVVLANKIACEEDEGEVETELASLALFSLTGSSVLREEWIPLLGRPDLVFESLLMNGVTDGIGEFLNRFKSWRNDSLLLRLARRAIRLEEAPTSVGEDLRIDIGLGGPWSLTGDESRDKKIRDNHRFSPEKPNMNLALKLLNLCNGDSKINANLIFDLADDLSLFLHSFVAVPKPLSVVVSSGLSLPTPTIDCPFNRPSFVRQAIICLVDILVRKFSKSFKTHVAENAVSNLDLLIDIWIRSSVRVGLKGISNPTTQSQLRDFLIQVDALDLAERVCFALGKDRPGAYESADIVNMERVQLAIQIGDLVKAREYACNFNAKKLSIEQLEKIETALNKQSEYIRLEDFEEAAKMYAISQMEERIGKRGSCEIGKKNLSLKTRDLIPDKFFKSRMIERFSVLSQVIDDDQVLIQTPVAVGGCFEEQVEQVSQIFELLFYCSEHGETGSSVYFLTKAGLVKEAVESAVESALTPKQFIASVSRAITPDSPVWSTILTYLVEMNSKTYLSAIETFLRSVCAYAPMYPYEVAMGREAHAAVVCIHLYLRACSWEERIGHLESSRSHLEICWSRRKFSKRLRGVRGSRRRDLSVSTSEVDDESGGDGSDGSDDYFHQVAPAKIGIPFVLPMSELDDDAAAIPDPIIQSLQTLVELQLEVLRLMPICAPSASLFGSIQSVSELIDYLLMDGHVGLAKRIIGKVKLPDSALCGIFDDI